MKPRYLTLLLLSVVFGGGCRFFSKRGSRANRTGKTQTEILARPIGQARSAIIRLNMHAGHLKLSGGALGLLDGSFNYNIPSWKPVVSYQIIDRRGMLSVTRPVDAHSNFHNNQVQYAWNLRVNNKLPIEISVAMSTGLADLDLAGTTLTNLNVQMGVGNLGIDLSGNWERNLAVSIKDRIGTITVRLPSRIGVRVEVGRGMGKVDAPNFKRNQSYYFNDAYGRARNTIDMRVDRDIGEINLQLAGGHQAKEHTKTQSFPPKAR